jgi:arsenate reductase-like glutaredoxin family protein
MKRYILFTKSLCSTCQVAKDMIVAHDLPVKIVNLDLIAIPMEDNEPQEVQDTRRELWSMLAWYEVVTDTQELLPVLCHDVWEKRPTVMIAQGEKVLDALQIMVDSPYADLVL